MMSPTSTTPGRAAGAASQDGAATWSGKPVNRTLVTNTEAVPLRIPDRQKELLAGHMGVLGEKEVARRLQRIPSDKLELLFPFQREGVEFGIRHNGRLLLADEMGLGKTCQAICIAAAFSDAWPLLVLCPSSLRLAWADQLAAWLPTELLELEPKEAALKGKAGVKQARAWEAARKRAGTDFANIIVIRTGVDIKKLESEADAGSHRIVIVSYDLAKTMKEKMRQFNTIIADESHMLKGPKAQRTMSIKPHLERAKHAILITGTPALSRPYELWTQLDALKPGMVGSMHQFGNRYCDPIPSPWHAGCDYMGATNMEELHAILKATVLVRRLKRDVLTQLPPKLRTRIRIDTDPFFNKTLKEIKDAMDAVKLDPELDEGDRERQLRMLLMKLWGTTGAAKVKNTQEHITTLLEKGRKILVFGHHSGVLDALEAHFKPKLQAMRPAASLVMVKGSSSMDKRRDAEHRFQSDPNCRLAVLSVGAAGVGINMTEADVVVFAELMWTPGSMQQAEDRTHRIGQAACVEIQYLHAEGTLDDGMWLSLQKKNAALGQALEGCLTGSAMGLKLSDAAETEAWQLAAARLAANKAAAQAADVDEGGSSPGGVGAGAAPPATPLPAAREKRPAAADLTGGEGSAPAPKRRKSCTPKEGWLEQETGAEGNGSVKVEAAMAAVGAMCGEGDARLMRAKAKKKLKRQLKRKLAYGV